MILLLESEYERMAKENYQRGIDAGKLLIFQMIREYQDKQEKEHLEEKENGSEGR